MDTNANRRARAAESIGLAVIALILVAAAIARWGHMVNWHVR